VHLNTSNFLSKFFEQSFEKGVDVKDNENERATERLLLFSESEKPLNDYF